VGTSSHRSGYPTKQDLADQSVISSTRLPVKHDGEWSLLSLLDRRNEEKTLAGLHPINDHVGV
jgi:hypothetical protein